MTVRTILVPVRGDGKGAGVLDHALCLARRHAAHLEVLHCRPRPEDLIPFGVFVPASLRKEIVSSAGTLANEEEDKVRGLFDRYCIEHDIPVLEAAPWPRDRITATWREETSKQAKVVAVRGRHAPSERRMGHAGTVNVFGQGGASEKVEALRDAGVTIAASPAEIGQTVRQAMRAA